MRPTCPSTGSWSTWDRTSPVAFEINNQVGALGNPFVFLLAGVATDYTEIGFLWSNVGRRTAILLPLVTVPQILLLGYLLNAVSLGPRTNCSQPGLAIEGDSGIIRAPLPGYSHGQL